MHGLNRPLLNGLNNTIDLLHGENLFCPYIWKEKIQKKIKHVIGTDAQFVMIIIIDFTPFELYLLTFPLDGYLCMLNTWVTFLA